MSALPLVKVIYWRRSHSPSGSEAETCECNTERLVTIGTIAYYDTGIGNCATGAANLCTVEDLYDG